VCGNVPDRDGSDGVSRRQALGIFGAVVSGGGVLAGLERSDAFATARAERDSRVDIERDSDAVVPITGKPADSPPRFGNEFATDLTITLSAPNEPSATFDVGTTGTTESVATFTVPPGTTTEVGMDADTTSISVAVDGVHGNGAVSLRRTFEVPTPTPAPTGESVETVRGSTPNGESAFLEFDLRVDSGVSAEVEAFEVTTPGNKNSSARESFRLENRADPEVRLVPSNTGGTNQTGEYSSGNYKFGDGRQPMDSNAVFEGGTTLAVRMGQLDNGNTQLTYSDTTAASSSDITVTVHFADDTSHETYLRVTNVNT
jgi:hypothetical protein